MARCPDPMELTIVIRNDTEISAIMYEISGHYGKIAHLYSKLAAMRERDDATSTDELAPKEVNEEADKEAKQGDIWPTSWPCPHCGTRMSGLACAKCGCKVERRIEVLWEPNEEKEAGTCPHGCGHNLRLNDFLDFDAITEASVWSCPGCERAIRVLNHGGSVFEAVATSDPVTHGAWYSEAGRKAERI